MGLVYGHVVRASIGWLIGSVMDAEEMRAREHKVSKDNFAKGKNSGH